MKAETSNGGEMSPAERAIREETIDRVAVFAVRTTAYMEPPIDVASFVSEFTHIDQEQVEQRLATITGGNDQPLRYDEKSGRLQANSDSSRAEALLIDTRDEILVGNTDFSIIKLRSLLAEAVEVQRITNAAQAKRQQYGADFDFSPEAPHRERSHAEKLAEYQGTQPGEPIIFPGPPIMIRSPRTDTP